MNDRFNKTDYIRLIDRVLDAYTDEHIRAYTESVQKGGIKEHGYPRLTANLGIVIAHGYRRGYTETFREMMELCCDEVGCAKAKNGAAAGNDFSIKELVLCLLEVEKAGIFDKAVTDSWRRRLSALVPGDTYSCIAAVPPVRIGNWAAFGAVSEQLRKYAGIGDESFFIDNQIKSQLFSFDENGMYRDPNEPMVYDFVTRLQLAAALYFGYDGEAKDALESELMKSADITLLMQSTTGEIPYGGRSNQFLHNESFFAALCEYYASVFAKKGDVERAGKFRGAARLAIGNIETWLEGDELFHVKNRYPNDSLFGCENYAYFDKYMVTCGSWLYLAYVMCDDTVPCVPCPASVDGGVNGITVTSGYFHKVFVKHNAYFAEFDTAADMHYDASGLGRIHKRGVPSALALSVPFSDHPNYRTVPENPSPLAVCVGVKDADGNIVWADSPSNSEYRLTNTACTDCCTSAEFECKVGGVTVGINFELSDGGAVYTASVADGREVFVEFPVFVGDGKYESEVTFGCNSVSAAYLGHRCTWSCGGSAVDTGEAFANRNGHYRRFIVSGCGSVRLCCALE